MKYLPTLLAGLSVPLVALAGIGLAGASSDPVGSVAPARAVLAPVADGEFTPQGGPEVNFVGNDVSFTDIEADQPMTCEQMDFAGTVVDPGAKREFGANLGDLAELTSSDCWNPTAGTIDVALVGSSTVSIIGPSIGTEWPARLNNVQGFIVAAGCEFTVAGSVDGVFDTATQVVTPTSNSIVIDEEPVGLLCPILGIEQGQTFDVEGTWQNVPPAGSSPLTLSQP